MKKSADNYRRCSVLFSEKNARRCRFCGERAGMPQATPKREPEVFDDSRECVVLLHGVGLNSGIMRRVEIFLKKAGYRVVNISYPSRTMPFEKIAGEFLPAKLFSNNAGHAPKLHFVTHSMGSLVLRLLCAGKNRPKNLGRTVMIGPPNHGSIVADKAGKIKFIRRVMGVNLLALGTGDAAITRKLGPADFEVGVIAGSVKINPLFRDAHTVNDGAVTAESARLEGMRDFMILRHSHTVMLWRSAVLRQVEAFLKNGKFERAG